MASLFFWNRATHCGGPGVSGIAVLGSSPGGLCQSVSGDMGSSRRAAVAGLPGNLSERAARRGAARDALFLPQAVMRAVNSRVDLRWGRDRNGFRRLLHPNGICLTGLWEITEATSYSGYFQRGSRAVVIVRYSTCCSATARAGTVVVTRRQVVPDGRREP
jgi:hypothetical protein